MKHIFLKSLLLTIAVFVIGVLLNYSFDLVRLDTIIDGVAENELDSSAYVIEREFAEVFGGGVCGVMDARIAKLKGELQDVSRDLGSYSKFSWLKKKDFDYLKHKLFLLELKFFSVISHLNNECGKKYIPILYFYRIDDEESERQGFILESVSKEFEKEVVVFSFDKDYEDEPLVSFLVDFFNITQAPTIIVDGKKIEGLVYEGEIRSRIKSALHPFDFELVVRAAGVNKTLLLEELEKPFANSSSNFAKGDILLVKGRLTDNQSLVCSAVQYYESVSKSNKEEYALALETIASLPCGADRRGSLKATASVWKSIGNFHRAEILESLSKGMRPELKFDASEIVPEFNKRKNVKEIVLGSSAITITPSTRIIAQVDRVTRDWLGGQLALSPWSKKPLSVFSERLTGPKDELWPEIGWHEGGRLKEILPVTKTFDVAVGTLIAKQDNKWYAPDDNGVFSFEVPIDKVLYPTTRFLTENIGVIIDSHGVNMLVEQSLRKKADVVISDCDHPGKVKAAAYLSSKGVKVACFPDKFSYLALGQGISLLASPPLKKLASTVVIGSQPVKISVNEPIVVINATDEKYALWYYQTPASYFSSLDKIVPLNLVFVMISDFNQTGKVIETAEEINSSVIAVRVFNKNDAEAVRSWLGQDKNNRAVLFHSASYPQGQLIFREFPEQTTFGDVNPVFYET